MKRLYLLFLVALFFTGCGTMGNQSEFWKHSSMYKNWDHTIYSIFGYRNPTKETGKNSQEQGWWGIEIPHIPAE